jgi:signal transduction histidine kinase/CheY-like chemotaxis protein
LSILLFVFLALGSALLATVTRHVVDDQERRLLDQQAQGAGALVSSTFTGQLSTYPLLGDLGVDPAGARLFAAAARPLAAAGSTIGVARRGPDGFTVQRVEGSNDPVDSHLDARLTALAERAATKTGLVSDVVPIDKTTRRLMFAAQSLSNPGVVTFSEFRLSDAILAAAADQPFGELDGALYVGDHAQPDRILLATTKLPLTKSPVVRTKVAVGAEQWLIVVAAKHPLVGDFARRLPWLVLASGLVAALLATALVEIVGRRRAYALRLVDERTVDLEMAREAAEAANRSKSEFLSRMSHELRTPLNAVLGFAQLLESDDLTPDQRESVRQILHGGRHLLGLINEVLDITRIEAGSFQLSPEPVSVGEVVDEVIELTAPLAVAARVDLGSDHGHDDRFVVADRQRLKQILLNLVGNAVKYNRTGGTVSVSCRQAADGKVRINVHDTGSGIAAEQVPLLFTPFERLGAERTGIEGSGVGLALSRRLAEAMGGTVDVETTLGHGSTFWVELPLANEPTGLLPRAELDDVPPQVPTEAGERRTILYIEDNLPNLRLVEQIFVRRSDIELLSAAEGTLGLELAARHQPALVLLDLHLPDMTGDEVLRRLRADPQTAEIPVVIISADATEGQIKRLLDQGATAYLTKPLDVAKLRALVDDLTTVAR